MSSLLDKIRARSKSIKGCRGVVKPKQDNRMLKKQLCIDKGLGNKGKQVVDRPMLSRRAEGILGLSLVITSPDAKGTKRKRSSTKLSKDKKMKSTKVLV